MKLESLTSRTRYLALALPLFALFSAVHGGCIRGPAGYGTYGNYGYGNRASALGRDSAEADEGECVVYAGDSGETYGNCDDDGYDGESGHGGHASP
jgi:hypothetical protein